MGYGYGMMGSWGGGWAGLLGGLFFFVWLAVGILAAVWLWRQIKK